MALTITWPCKRPTYQINTIDDIANLPITTSKLNQPELLKNLGRLGRSTTAAVVSHYGITPVFDIYINTENRDLGGVTEDIKTIVEEFRKQAPQWHIFIH